MLCSSYPQLVGGEGVGAEEVLEAGVAGGVGGEEGEDGFLFGGGDGELGAGEGTEDVEEGEGGGVGDAVGAGGVATGGGVGGGGVVEEAGGGEQQGLELGVELGIGGFEGTVAAQEDAQGSGVGWREGLAATGFL